MEKINDKISLSLEVRMAIFLLVILWALVLVGDFFQKKPIIKVETVPVRATSMEEIAHGDIAKKQIIFTFDGGDGTLSASKVLYILAKHKIKGTFFLTGKFIETNQDLARRIHREGHEIFSHTYDHPYLTQIVNGDIIWQMKKTNQILEQVVGITSRPYFRAPYGDRDQRVIEQAFGQGYQSVYWTVDAMDWQQSEGRSESDVKYLILSSLASGNIYLMHLGDSITGNILDEVFTEIENKGYKIVSLTQGI